MKNIFLGLVLTLGATGLASAGDGDAEASFDTPSHNMCCHYIPAGGNGVYTTPDGSAELTCSRQQPQYWTVSLTELGRFKVDKNPGEVPGCGNEEVLAYGKTRHDGPFTCTSRTSGLTCKTNGKGFTLSKKGLKKIN